MRVSTDVVVMVSAVVPVVVAEVAEYLWSGGDSALVPLWAGLAGFVVWLFLFAIPCTVVSKRSSEVAIRYWQDDKIRGAMPDQTDQAVVRMDSSK